MTNKYNIAVIEDNPKHLEDVRGLLTNREDIVEAVYATNLADALKILDSRPFDGVLSDAHFPKIFGGPEAPCGIDIIDYTMNRRMPISIVTSAYHHGTKTEPIFQRALQAGIDLIDEYIQGDKEGESSSKRWGEGLARLVFLIDSLRTGQLKFDKTFTPYLPKERWSIGMNNNNGEPIRFSLPPYQEANVLDEIKQRLRL